MRIEVDETITLKQVQAFEYQDMFDLVDKNRTQLREWLPWLDFVTEADDYKSTIQAWVEKNDAGESMTLGLYVDNQLAGMCGYNTIDLMNKKGAIGYWLAEEFGGQGVMTRAVKGLTDYGFKQLELHRIEISAGVCNKKSRAIPERLNFYKEAILKDAEFLYDHYHDLVLYRMIKDDWLTEN